MSLFDSILEKLGLKKTGAAAKPAATPTTGPGSTASEIYHRITATAAAAPAPIPMVDVVSKLENLARKNPQKLNWKESIVDLLKLLGLPSGSNDLKELADELKCPADIIDNSFKRNMWLHKTVLKKLADNGGNIPRDLLD